MILDQDVEHPFGGKGVYTRSGIKVQFFSIDFRRRRRWIWLLKVIDMIEEKTTSRKIKLK